jgi:hypothetical protein
MSGLDPYEEVLVGGEGLRASLPAGDREDVLVLSLDTQGNVDFLDGYQRIALDRRDLGMLTGSSEAVVVAESGAIAVEAVAASSPSPEFLRSRATKSRRPTPTKVTGIGC